MRRAVVALAVLLIVALVAATVAAVRARRREERRALRRTEVALRLVGTVEVPAYVGSAGVYTLDFRDGWQQPIRFRMGKYWEAWSLGPNGIDEQGGGDDIRGWGTLSSSYPAPEELRVCSFPIPEIVPEGLPHRATVLHDWARPPRLVPPPPEYAVIFEEIERRSGRGEAWRLDVEGTAMDIDPQKRALLVRHTQEGMRRIARVLLEMASESP